MGELTPCSLTLMSNKRALLEQTFFGEKARSA